MTQTMNPFSVRLDLPAHEMAQEEITKQVAFLSPGIRNVGFEESGAILRFDAPTGDGDQLLGRAKTLAGKVQRGLRTLKRKIVYRSKAADRPVFRDVDLTQGIHFTARGQVALEGMPLQLFRYFDRIFEAFGAPWKPRPLMTPTLISAKTLSRCDYFRSFPNNVTFAAHLMEDGDRIENFRARHAAREDLDDKALGDMVAPECCLSPAVCYHVYHIHENQVLPAAATAFGVCGKCFRYESTNLSDLRRLWDFTMREVVFLGGKDEVLTHRDVSMDMMAKLLDEHELAGEIRTASDPFFIAPDAVAKTYFQLSSETKFEISLMLPGDARLAVGSHNYHTDFFGRAFNVTLDAGGFMHSVCVAFGLERWVYGFLVQHGGDMSKWPAVVRRAPEFSVHS